MYNILRSDSGGVVLKCKACSHSAQVNEFDGRAANVARPQTEVAIIQLSGALFSVHRWQS